MRTRLQWFSVLLILVFFSFIGSRYRIDAATHSCGSVTTIDFTIFPDGTPIPNETEIFDQFAS